MLLIDCDTVYEGWMKLNHEFLNTDIGMLIPNRDFSRIIKNVRITAKDGFGFPKNPPPFFASYDRRINLLAKRYIEPELWDEGIERLKARHTKKRRLAKNSPLSFVMNFHRRETSERKVPAGGGCLQTITFIWFDNHWALHVYLRASEITARLVADIAFVNWAVRNVLKEVELKNWGTEPLEITWDIALASQMKYLYIPFLLYTEGEEYVKEFVLSEEHSGDWGETIIEHFWETFIHPKKITWAQRRKWSEKFLEATKTDWSEYV